MKKLMAVICGVAGFLGVLSALLGFASEARQHILANKIELKNHLCYPPRSEGLPALGGSAGLVLAIAQALLNLAAGWLCCARDGPYPQNPTWIVAMACLILSWIAFVSAIGLFLAGAVLNSKDAYYCYGVTSGLFAGGAVLALATVGLGIMYYIKVSAVKMNSKSNGHGQTQNPNISMGQPQYNDRPYVWD